MITQIADIIIESRRIMAKKDSKDFKKEVTKFMQECEAFFISICGNGSQKVIENNLNTKRKSLMTHVFIEAEGKPGGFLLSNDNDNDNHFNAADLHNLKYLLVTHMYSNNILTAEDPRVCLFASVHKGLEMLHVSKQCKAELKIVLKRCENFIETAENSSDNPTKLYVLNHMDKLTYNAHKLMKSRCVHPDIYKELMTRYCELSPSLNTSLKVMNKLNQLKMRVDELDQRVNKCLEIYKEKKGSKKTIFALEHIVNTTIPLLRDEIYGILAKPTTHSLNTYYLINILEKEGLDAFQAKYEDLVAVPEEQHTNKIEKGLQTAAFHLFSNKSAKDDRKNKVKLQLADKEAVNLLMEKPKQPSNVDNNSHRNLQGSMELK